MKTVTIAIVLMFFTAIAASTQQPAQVASQTVYAYGMPQHRLAVTNTAPWMCRIVTVAPVGKFGRSVQAVGIADLAPGESVVAGKEKGKKTHFSLFSLPSIIGYDRSSNLQIPIVALYYQPVDGKNEYVGAAAGTFYVPGYGNSSVGTMTLTERDIRFANDTATNAPQVQSVQAEKYAPIPYFGTDGTSVQVFVWNSSTPAHITVNGDSADTLELGNVKAYVGWSPIVVTISAIAPDGTVKTWSRGFQNSNYYGTYAQIFILGMSDLR
jgi:hypothetical protein